MVHLLFFLGQHRTMGKTASIWQNKDMNKQITMSGLSDELAHIETKKKNFWCRSIG